MQEFTFDKHSGHIKYPEEYWEARRTIEKKFQHWFETYSEDRIRFIANMKADGYEIVYPKENEIQIDIDTEKQEELFWEQFCILTAEFGELLIRITESKGGPPGKHITIEFPRNLNAVERIAYQAALGSDPLRELLSLFRVNRLDDYPTLFIEKGGK